MAVMEVINSPSQVEPTEVHSSHAERCGKQPSREQAKSTEGIVECSQSLPRVGVPGAGQTLAAKSQAGRSPSAGSKCQGQREKSPKECPQCGEQGVACDAIYCVKCGGELAERVACRAEEDNTHKPQQPPRRRCPACQTPCEPSGLFCVECGGKLEEAKAAPAQRQQHSSRVVAADRRQERARGDAIWQEHESAKGKLPQQLAQGAWVAIDRSKRAGGPADRSTKSAKAVVKKGDAALLVKASWASESESVDELRTLPPPSRSESTDSSGCWDKHGLETPSRKRCIGCKRPGEPSASFCVGCGGKLAEAQVEATPAPRQQRGGATLVDQTGLLLECLANDAKKQNPKSPKKCPHCHESSASLEAVYCVKCGTTLQEPKAPAAPRRKRRGSSCIAMPMVPISSVGDGAEQVAWSWCYAVPAPVIFVSNHCGAAI